MIDRSQFERFLERLGALWGKEPAADVPCSHVRMRRGTSALGQCVAEDRLPLGRTGSIWEDR
jgi:hypothetical protein